VVDFDVAQDFPLSDRTAFAALLQNGKRLIRTTMFFRLLASLVATFDASI